jgi:hypothetical protein
MLAIALAGTVAGLVAAVGAIASLVAASAALIQARKNQASVIEVHAIVNSAMTELRKRNEQLVGALQASGVKIPESPEKP